MSVALLAATSSSGQLMTAGSEHSRYILAVDEYMPAPGQFVNTLPAYEDGDDAASMAAKCTAAIAAGKGGTVTLGAYGGYITFHFDHSIANVSGSRDFYIAGNAYKGSSEPGVVMVSKDVNRNGIPDDPWYELAGSADADSVGKVVYGYEITYSQAPLENISWTDNRGGSGAIARNPFHAQEYFPQWVSGPLTFTGTLLPSNAVNTGSVERPYWVLESYRCGYADNVSNSDTLGCSFDIAWAVDADRNPVQLDFIDFVRVYNATNVMCGNLGESSTEITGAEDLHTDASVAAIIASESQTATFEDIVLDSESYWNGSDKRGTQIDGGYGSTAYAGSFVSGTYRFGNTYNDTWGSWSGFAVSNQTSVVFDSYADQYHSAVGHGHDNSANFAVAFPSGETVEVLNKPEGEIIRGFYLTNSANNVKAYKEGDGYTGKFAAGDWCKVTITGMHADSTVSTVDAYLADYRSSDPSLHGYLDYWQWVDLAELGKVVSLSFEVTSTHGNDWGMTTPGYFCIDDFNGQPDGTSGIAGARDAAVNVSAARYSVDGRRLDAPRRGVNIVRMSDGTVRKIFVK